MGVDEAPATGDAVDLDGSPRLVDLNDRPNGPGAQDLGPYEIQTQLPPSSCSASDIVFCNGFE